MMRNSATYHIKNKSKSNINQKLYICEMQE